MPLELIGVDAFQIALDISEEDKFASQNSTQSKPLVLDCKYEAEKKIKVAQ